LKIRRLNRHFDAWPALKCEVTHYSNSGIV
jgi:hypothetical protein